MYNTIYMHYQIKKSFNPEYFLGYMSMNKLDKQFGLINIVGRKNLFIATMTLTYSMKDPIKQ